MAEIKNSEALDRILRSAALLMDGARSDVVTAEAFVLAASAAVLRNNSNDEGIGKIKALFADHGISAVILSSRLIPKVSGMTDVPFASKIYMNRTMFLAKQSAERNGATELTPEEVFAQILNDPPAIVDAALKDAINAQPSDGHTDSETVSENGTNPEGENGVTGETESSTEGTDDSEREKHDTSPEIRRILNVLTSDDGTDADRDSERDPRSELSELVSDTDRIRTELRKYVHGQDNAINVFATGYFRAGMLSMLDGSRKRPRASFLFAGPPGVGKTFLAEKVADVLKLPFMRFDMSEYSDKEANLEFCGSDKVYKNSKSGNVTGFVAEHPKCILLFDEIEKAHSCIIHLFLQILDAGRLRDNYTDEEVSFSDAIIIMTTNAGKQLYTDNERVDLSTVSKKVVINALRTDVKPETDTPFFPAAICSRFASGNVVMFNHMRAGDLLMIARKEIERHSASFEKETGIKLSIDEAVYPALLFAEGGAADARTVRSRAETFFNDELYELFRLVSSDKVKTGIEEIERIRIGVDMSHANADVAALFTSEEDSAVLVFADDSAVSACRDAASDIEIIGVKELDAAIEAVKGRNIDLVLLDMSCGASSASLNKLNIEDVESPARDFFKFLREHGNGLPVYIIERNGSTLSEAEKTSFLRQGVKGTIKLTRNSGALAARIRSVTADLYRQASMDRLARENKIVTFETAQFISKNGKNADIKLFDFDMKVSVDSEDAKNVLGSASKPDVHFDDVIGASDAKRELTYFVEYLKNPKKYMGTGVKAPKGVLLYGPPGTGKTMLAKAMACESGVTFIAAEGNQFLKKYVGEGADLVHDLFRTARKYSPSVLFIDEIDAIAKERRGGENAGATGEEILTAFLTEMDGFGNDPSKPVFVLAATNFEVEPGGDKSLDPALMRRFDRRVYIDLPSKADRKTFLERAVAKKSAMRVSAEQIDNISLRAIGMSLADLDSVIELALRSAIREGSTVVTDAILEEAFETFNNGETKKWDTSQLERVARHEAGHTLLCRLSGETPSYLTVVARGNHGGYMQHAESEGKAIYTRDELLARIRTALGGRAAEIVYYGERDGISTGASGDLASATKLAQQLVCTYGMDEEFGIAVLPASVTVGGAIAPEVRAAVNRILGEQMAEAVKAVSENKDKIDALVEELMLKNHLNGAEIERVLGGKE